MIPNSKRRVRADFTAASRNVIYLLTLHRPPTTTVAEVAFLPAIWFFGRGESGVLTREDARKSRRAQAESVADGLGFMDHRS